MEKFTNEGTGIAIMKNRKSGDERRKGKMEERIDSQKEEFGQSGPPPFFQGRWFGFFIPENILPLIYADVDRILFLYQKRAKRRNWLVLLLMLGIVLFLNLTSRMSVLSLVSLCTAVTAIWYFSIRKVFGDGHVRAYGQRQARGQLSKGLAGNWQVSIGPDGYEIHHGDVARQVSSREKRRVYQTNGAYFIFDDQVRSCDIFLKSMFHSVWELQEWERQYRMWGWPEKNLDQKRVQWLANSRWAAIVIFGLAMTVYVMEPFVSVLYRLYTNPSVVSETIRPDSQKNYQEISVDTQVRVLRELGFTITEEEAAGFKKQAEENPEWMEENPYVSLLIHIGAGEYDEKKKERIPSYEAYWFDFEGTDISYDYIYMMEGIRAMAGEDFELTEMREDCSQVDWEKGTGMITVSFRYNGNAHFYEADVDYDWLDGGFISFFNDVLQMEGNEKRLYMAGDEGQGGILFYRDKTWAQLFADKTGIPLHAR